MSEEESKVKAKTISKIMKAVCAIGMTICSVLKWCGLLPLATIGEIVLLWATMYGVCAGTIDLNIIIDKFTGGN